MTHLRQGLYNVITLDEALYCKAKMIQWSKSAECKNLVIMLGGFHAQMTFSKEYIRTINSQYTRFPSSRLLFTDYIYKSCLHQYLYYSFWVFYMIYIIIQNNDLSNIHNHNTMSRCPNTIMFLQHPTFPQLRINRFITDNVIGIIAIYKETLLRCIKC